MALTTNYKSTLDVDFNVHTAQSEQLLKRISDNIRETEKMLLTYSKSISEAYEKHLSLAKRITNANTKSLKIQLEMEKLKRPSIIKAELALEQEKLKLQNKALNIQKAKITAKTKEKIKEEEIRQANRLAVIEAEKRLAQEKSLIKLKEKELLLEKSQQVKMSIDNNWLNARKELAKYHHELKETGSTMDSTFTRAFKTVPAFYAAYMIIDGIQTAFTETVKTALIYDNTMRTLSAVTDANLDVTSKLTKEIMNLGNAYGGSLEDLAKTSQELARAGIATEELASATKVATQLALITGDTIQTATNAVVSYSEVYAKSNGKMIYSTQELGDKLAYMANASRLSVQDIGTLSNYALASSKAIGLTIDQVNGLAISFANAGNNASTIGTQIRRFSSTLSSNSSAVKEFYKAIGVNRSELISELGRSKDGTKEGIEASNKAFEEFVMKVKSLSENEYRNAIYGMNVLDNQFFNQLRNNGDEVIKHMKTSFSDLTGELEKTAVIADGIGKRWEKMWNKMTNSMSEPTKALADSSTSFAEYLTMGAGDLIERLSNLDKRDLVDQYVNARNSAFFSRGSLRDLQEKDNKSEYDKSEMDRLAILIQQYDLQEKILQLKLDNKKVDEGLLEQQKLLAIKMHEVQDVQTEVTRGHRLDSAEVTAIHKKYREVYKALKDSQELHKKELLQQQAKKDLTYIIANIKKNKELKADESVVKSLNRQAYLKAKIAGLSNDEIKQLGIVVDELTKIESKSINIKSIQKDQLRDLGTYGKLVSSSTTSTDDPMFKAFENQMANLIDMQSRSLTQYKQDLLRLVTDASKMKLHITDPKDVLNLTKEVDLLVKSGKYSEARKKSTEATTKLYKIRTDLLTEEQRLVAEGVSRDDDRFKKITTIKESIEGWLRGQADLNKELLITDEAYNKVNKNASKVTEEAKRTSKAIIKAANDTLAFSDRMGQLAVQTQMLALKWEAFKGNLKSTDLGQIKVNLEIDNSKNKISNIKKQMNDLWGNMSKGGDASTIMPEYKKKLEDLRKEELKLGNLQLKNEELIRANKEKTLNTETQLKNVQTQISVVGKDRITQAKAQVEIAKANLDTAMRLNKDKGANRNELEMAQKRLALKQAEANLTKTINDENTKGHGSLNKTNKYQMSIEAELEKQKALLKDINAINNKDDNISLTEAKNALDAQKNIVKEYEKFKKTNRLKYEKAVTKELELQSKYLKLAQKEADKYSNYFKKMFDSLLNGDIVGSVKGLFSNISKDLLEKPLKDLSDKLGSGLTDMTSKFANMFSKSFGETATAIAGPIIGMVASFAGKALGSLLDGWLNKEQTPPELESIHKTSQSMANALDFIKNAQNPLLSYTEKQTEYLSVIAKSFGNIGNKILTSDVDFSGVSYQELSKGNIYSTKTYELYGTSLQFNTTNLSNLMTGQLQVMLDEAVKKTYDSLFKHRVTYDDRLTNVSDLIAEDIASATRSMFGSLLNASKLLGLNVSLDDLLSEQIAIGNIETTGKSGAEIAKLIEERFGATFDELATKYFGNAITELQKAGEGLAETLSRVSVTFEQTASLLGQVGQQVNWQNANYLVDAIGGMDEFNSTWNNYIDNFYSDAEKWAMKQKTLSDSFASLGVTLPKTKQDFKNLIETFDITDKSSSELYASLLKLSAPFSEFIDLQESLKNSTDNTNDSLRKSLQATLDWKNRILNEIDSFWSSNLSYLNSAEKAQKYSDLSNYYDSVGDSERRLTALKTQLEYEKQLATTREEYAYKSARYLYDIKNLEQPKNTLDDVVKSIDDLRQELVEVNNKIVVASNTNIEVNEKIYDVLEAEQYRV